MGDTVDTFNALTGIIGAVDQHKRHNRGSWEWGELVQESKQIKKNHCNTFRIIITTCILVCEGSQAAAVITLNEND